MEATPVPNDVEAFDKEWFPRFERVFFEDYEKLSGTG